MIKIMQIRTIARNCSKIILSSSKTINRFSQTATPMNMMLKSTLSYKFSTKDHNNNKEQVLKAFQNAKDTKQMMDIFKKFSQKGQSLMREGRIHQSLQIIRLKREMMLRMKGIADPQTLECVFDQISIEVRLQRLVEAKKSVSDVKDLLQKNNLELSEYYLRILVTQGIFKVRDQKKGQAKKVYEQILELCDKIPLAREKKCFYQCIGKGQMAKIYMSEKNIEKAIQNLKTLPEIMKNYQGNGDVYNINIKDIFVPQMIDLVHCYGGKGDKESMERTFEQCFQILAADPSTQKPLFEKILQECHNLQCPKIGIKICQFLLKSADSLQLEIQLKMRRAQFVTMMQDFGLAIKYYEEIIAMFETQDLKLASLQLNKALYNGIYAEMVYQIKKGNTSLFSSSLSTSTQIFKSMTEKLEFGGHDHINLSISLAQILTEIKQNNKAIDLLSAIINLLEKNSNANKESQNNAWKGRCFDLLSQIYFNEKDYSKSTANAQLASNQYKKPQYQPFVCDRLIHLKRMMMSLKQSDQLNAVKYMAYLIQQTIIHQNLQDLRMAQLLFDVGNSLAATDQIQKGVDLLEKSSALAEKLSAGNPRNLQNAKKIKEIAEEYKKKIPK